MLRELHISNLAVIEDACVEFEPGLNCFTGQTGAGKSLILGAFEILLGLRPAGDLLRAGASEGRVSGVFELHDGQVIQRINELVDAGLEVAGGGAASGGGQQLLITRKLFESGRTSISINGRPATMSMLRGLGELLVDVHGQHDHQFLLKGANQLLMLDRFGETEELREGFAAIHRQIRELELRKAALRASGALRRQQLELYEFQAAEIDEAEPTAGEFEELSARSKLLNNLEKIKRQAGHAHAALYEAEGAIIERLQGVTAVIGDLAELDSDLSQTLEMLKTGLAHLQDADISLSRYVDRLDLDPAELQEVSQRLNVLNRLIQKYGSRQGRLDEVLAYRAKIEAEMMKLRGQTEDLQSIETQLSPLRKQLAEAGAKLSKKRKAAAERLVPLVERELAELGMAEAKLQVSFTDRPLPREAEPTGAEAEEELEEGTHGGGGGEGTASGLDEIEILIQPNPGQPPRPLRKTASGGELSRIMLALKSILAQADRVSVLVFDEIDSNVGGRMGTTLGNKLKKLAKHHQVLCITHLPQIAAFADNHLRIAKSIADGQTSTKVNRLRGKERILELAEMLTGKNPTATSQKQAQEMIDLAVEVPATSRRQKV